MEGTAKCIKLGYEYYRKKIHIAVARRPPRFNGVMSAVHAQNAPFLRAEIHNLLAKGALEIHPEERESGFTVAIFWFSRKTVAFTLSWTYAN